MVTTTGIDYDLGTRALLYAADAHRGQMYAGVSYLYHLSTVSMASRMFGEIPAAIGALHDVVEDTDTTLEDLHAAGFPREVVRGVDALTRRGDESYAEYIERVAYGEYVACDRISHTDTKNSSSWGVPYAVVVKLADNLHNTYDARHGGKRNSLMTRYSRAFEVLTGVCGEYVTDEIVAYVDGSVAGYRGLLH